jgi:hypothetical protein
MDDPTESAPSLIRELDQRQNAVISELDALNERIEAAIAAWQVTDDEPISVADAA